MFESPDDQNILEQIDLARSVFSMLSYDCAAVIVKSTSPNGTISCGFHFDDKKVVGDTFMYEDGAAGQVRAIVRPVKRLDGNLEIQTITDIDEKYWCGGKAPWSMREQEFMDVHCTGYINDSAYDNYQAEGGMAWLGAADKYPLIVMQDENGIEFRKSIEPCLYTKRDEKGSILRHTKTDEPIYFSPAEMVLKRLAPTDHTIVAFSEGVAIGCASNEFGAVGVWVERRFQGKGIGTTLLKRYLEENPGTRIGQMTSAGIGMTKKVRRLFWKSEARSFA